MSNKERYILPSLSEGRKRSRNEKDVIYGASSALDALSDVGIGKKYYIRTYGCQANVRDGETLAGMLEMMGYEKTDNEREADVLIFNTCAVRQAAEERVFGEIGSLKKFRMDNPDKIICMCGCMPQEEVVVERILNQYPQVDLVFGTHNIYRFPELLKQVLEERQRVIEVISEEGRVFEDLPVRRSTQGKAFVNIMYGCDKFCTYCIVPYTRGTERSRKIEDILKEVKSLQEKDYKEVILLGQNVNAYGKDLGMEDGFTDLLIACAETGIERIRFYTSHPRDYSISTIEAMKKYPNIMKSLHLPVQSGNNEILKRMNRGYTRERYFELFDDMKERIPEITFTTDLIVGFPGETEEEFLDTLSLVDHCQFDMAYSFVYSPRSGTPAANMQDDVSAEEKKDRLFRLNEKLAKYANEKNQAYVGKLVKVLCEGSSKKNKDVYTGYSEENKLVNFTGPKGLENQIVEVEITEAHSFSLDGKALV